MTRRTFAAAAAATSFARGAASKPAILGGNPVRREPFPSWPKIEANDEREWMNVLRSGAWYRGSGRSVAKFERAYASLLGAPHCLATANGTSALIVSLNALGIGPGDEVIVPPYTFVATVNAVLIHHALPVFADTNLDTFQIDANSIEPRVTGATRLVIPVHLGGAAADMDAVSAAARKRNIAVLEDACQAHLGEWKGKKVGTLGAAGCFSFQASKNLNSGEGGAIVSHNEEFIDRCFAFHNNSRGRKASEFNYTHSGVNLRLTEFQATLLMTQMERLERQSALREQNATHLTSLLREIPGIHPARMHEGCTRNAYHLYMFRYDKEQFAGLSRTKFLKALRAEGIPGSSGYSPLNQEPFLENTLKRYEKIYPRERLARWREENRCPNNDRLCREAVWFTQTMLLDTKEGMEQIAEAIRKIQKSARDIETSA